MTNFDIILKFILGFEACENKTKEMSVLFIA